MGQPPRQPVQLSLPQGLQPFPTTTAPSIWAVCFSSERNSIITLLFFFVVVVAFVIAEMRVCFL